MPAVYVHTNAPHVTSLAFSFFFFFCRIRLADGRMVRGWLLNCYGAVCCSVSVYAGASCYSLQIMKPDANLEQISSPYLEMCADSCCLIMG